MKKHLLKLFLFLSSTLIAQRNPDAFIFKYSITEANEAVAFNIGDPTKVFDYNVDWGDGTTNDNLTDAANHTYTIPGEYEVSITGIFPTLTFFLNPIVSIEQWGTNEWESCARMFHFNSELTSINATDIPNFSPNTSLELMFANCDQFDADINNWNVSNVTNMTSMFLNAFKFNSPLNDWNVSNVTLMSAMFNNAEAFNQPLNDWNVSNVTDMTSMFEKAESFNRPINDWTVSKVKGMQRMFSEATKFNQPLNNWDVSEVISMLGMFNRASTFNQNINNWITSSLTNTTDMFNTAVAFDQPLDNWNMSKVKDMGGMFLGATVFNQNINSWDTSSLESVTALFENAITFNQPLDNWDLSNINGQEAYQFVFSGATSFDQPLENWYPRQGSDILSMFAFLDNSGISSENYTKTLNAWARAIDILEGDSLDVFSLGAENVDYCDEALVAINILENDLNWRLNHRGIDPDCTGATLSTVDFDTIRANENVMYFNYNTSALDITTKDNANLKVYDLLGREVMSTKIKRGETSQNLNELQPSIYIAKLENEVIGQNKILKVILN